MFVTLYAPGAWGPIANEILYPLIHNIQRSAKSANATTSGLIAANLADEDIHVNENLLQKILRQPPQSYSTTAIYAADSWASDNSTTRDVYDMIVKTSREVSPMCTSLDPPFLLTGA